MKSECASARAADAKDGGPGAGSPDYRVVREDTACVRVRSSAERADHSGRGLGDVEAPVAVESVATLEEQPAPRGIVCHGAVE